MSFFSRAARAIGGAIAKNIQFREVLLLGGAALVGAGLALVWLPAAFIVPGLMLAYVSIFGVK